MGLRVADRGSDEPDQRKHDGKPSDQGRQQPGQV
jgi:hypothetical protein